MLIEKCTFDTGDDCIAIKSGRNADGRRIGVPSENIIIRGCTMKDGHGGVTLGSEMSGGIRNVFVEDCVMGSPNLDRAIRLKSNSTRGGYLENLFVRNVASAKSRRRSCTSTCGISTKRASSTRSSETCSWTASVPRKVAIRYSFWGSKRRRFSMS